jgi:tRNA (cytidine/uridine-2'-O-)-methyltransferase
MRLALYEPDIPQNTGTILRLAACLGVAVDLIEPFGFPFDDRRMRRSGMDYLDRVEIRRHVNWAAFQTTLTGRIVLLTTAGDRTLPGFTFEPTDVLLLGRETAGVPPAIHEAADIRLRIPMQPEMRSLNIALAAALALGEGLRQTGGWPG